VKRIVGSATVLLLLWASPAYGHSNEATLEVIKSEVSGSLTQHYDVLLTYAGDGHQVEDATVTLVAERKGAAALTPVVLRPVTQKGLYQGEVSVPEPGEWNVRVTAVSPIALLEKAETFVVSNDLPTVTTAPSEQLTEESKPTKVQDNRVILAVGVMAVLLLLAVVLIVRRRRD
jgi:hypothetical protein